MQVIVDDIIHNRQALMYDRNAGFTVGSTPDNNVVLAKSRFVSPRHFAVDMGAAEGKADADDKADAKARDWLLTVFPDATSVEVDGETVQPGATVVLRKISSVRIANYRLTLRQLDDDDSDRENAMEIGINKLQREIHQKVLTRLNANGQGDNLKQTPAIMLKISTDIEDIIRNDYSRELGPGGIYRLPLLTLAIQKHKYRLHKPAAESGPAANGGNQDDSLEDYLDKLRGLADGEIADVAAEMARTAPENVQFKTIVSYIQTAISDLLFGFGPLQNLLDMANVSEIMVVSPSLIYVEQDGKVVKTSASFLGDAELIGVLERIVAPLGRRIDRSSPLVDARLPDGSRVNAVIPPLALKGACLTIRRFPEERITAEHLLRWGSLTPEALELVRGLVRGRKSIIVAGGTGSGKTTMLNVISGFIDEHERLITIEDSAELQLQHEHLVALETRPENVEGKGAVTIRDLIKNALRMRPDRIIVGECRGGEAFDMLQAMNTGHNGSMTTVHANNPAEVITRLEAMCLMAVDIPVMSLRQQIAQAVDYIIYLARLSNGQRMTTAIAEVGGIDPQSGSIDVRIIMRANFHPEDGRYYLEPNGYIPQCLPELAAKGLVDVNKVYPNG